VERPYDVCIPYKLSAAAIWFCTDNWQLATDNCFLSSGLTDSAGAESLP